MGLAARERHVGMIKLFPWLELVAAMRFRMVFDIKKLAVAGVGLLVLQLGWAILARWLDPSPTHVTLVFEPEMRDLYSRPFWDPGAIVNRLGSPFWWTATTILWSTARSGAPSLVVRGVLAFLWMDIVAAIAGGVVCRMIMVEIARGERIGIRQAFRFVRKRIFVFLLAPLCPALLVLFFSALIALYGLVFRIPVIGPVVGAIGLVVPLALGLCMAISGVLLLLGWPFFIAAAASGADDPLDAFSRVFSYFQQRLGSLVVPAAYAWLSGMIGLAFLRLLEQYTLRLAAQNLWTSGIDAADRSFAFFGFGAGTGLAGLLHDGWMIAIQLLVDGWIWCFYAVAACYAYVWMRGSVDGSPWDDVDGHARHVQPEDRAFTSAR